LLYDLIVGLKAQFLAALAVYCKLLNTCSPWFQSKHLSTLCWIREAADEAVLNKVGSIHYTCPLIGILNKQINKYMHIGSVEKNSIKRLIRNMSSTRRKLYCKVKNLIGII
jgi:hypothetical protein